MSSFGTISFQLFNKGMTEFEQCRRFHLALSTMMSKCVHFNWKDWPSDMTPYLIFPSQVHFQLFQSTLQGLLHLLSTSIRHLEFDLETNHLTSSQNSQDLFQQVIMVKGSAVEEAANFPSLSSEISLETIFCPVNLWHHCADPGVGHCHHWWLQLQ